jgi:hypothetical protein
MCWLDRATIARRLIGDAGDSRPGPRRVIFLLFVEPLAKGYEYRQHAQQCLRLADQMGSPEHRALLFDMARAWHQLAQDYERSEWPETVTIDC